jgi:hypothetical protein
MYPPLHCAIACTLNNQKSKVARAAGSRPLAEVIRGSREQRNSRDTPWVRYLLVQREMERGRSPLVSIPPFGRGFSRHWVYRSDVVPARGRKRRLRAPVHRLDEPTGLSLSMVASPQCRFRFARQNHCSAAATSGFNFRLARNPDRAHVRHGDALPSGF